MTPPSIETAIEQHRELRVEIYRLDRLQVLRDAHAALAVARDHLARVAYELVQNPEDAMASLIAVHLDEASQTFFLVDDGIGVSPSSVASLSGLYFSEKSSGIGRKGVGFKAVYSVTDRPAIVSGQDAVVFDPELAKAYLQKQGLETTHVPHQWLPFYRTRLELEERHPFLRELREFRTVVVLPARDAGAVTSLRSELNAFDGRSLLTFRHVRTFEIRAQPAVRFHVTVNRGGPEGDRYSLADSRSQEPSVWQVQWTRWEAPADALASLDQDERERARFADVMLAVELRPVAPTTVGRLGSPAVATRSSNLLVYYPTQHLAPSRCLTHADFTTTTDRTQIADPTKHAYNLWLAERMAKATVDFSREWVERSEDSTALKLLAPDARRKDGTEQVLRELTVSAARNQLFVHSLSGQQILARSCRVVEVGDPHGFLSLATRTALADTLPTAEVLNDQDAVATLLELGATPVPRGELLEVLSAALKANPDRGDGQWALSLWRWLMSILPIVAGTSHDGWRQRLDSFPFLPGVRAWVAPSSLRASPFFLGSLLHPSEGVCQIEECDPSVRGALEAAADRAELTKFLRVFGVEEDPQMAQLRALDAATRAYCERGDDESPERFARAICEWGLLELERPEGLLRNCPLPVRTTPAQGKSEFSWAPAWQGYWARGRLGHHLRLVLRNDPDVLWVQQKRLEELGIDSRIITWLGCPQRPEIVVPEDGGQPEEGQRVLAILRALNQATGVGVVAPPKLLLNVDPETLGAEQLSSLFVILATEWDSYYEINARKRVQYFRYSRRYEDAVDEPWWAGTKALTVATRRPFAPRALSACRLALDKEVQDLRPFTPQPALPGISLAERERVLEWLGRAVKIGLRLQNLTWEDWDTILGRDLVEYWRNRNHERGAVNRIRNAYRLFWRWRKKCAQSSPLLRHRRVLCEGPGGAEIVDAQTSTVYLDDDRDLRQAAGSRIYIANFPETTPLAIAASLFGLTRLSACVQGPEVVECEDRGGELAHVLNERIRGSRALLLALARHSRQEEDYELVEKQVRILKLRLVQRIDLVAELKGQEGHFRLPFRRDFFIQQDTCVIAIDTAGNEAEVIWRAAFAIAHVLQLGQLHWAVKELLQTDDAEQQGMALARAGVSRASIEDSGFALDSRTGSRSAVPSQGGTGQRQQTLVPPAASTRREAAGTAPHTSAPVASNPAAASSRVPTLKDGRTASYILNTLAPSPGGVSDSVRPSSDSRPPPVMNVPTEADRADIETQSRAVCVRILRENGFDVREMSVTNPGFDLLATRSGRQHRIEVKGHLGESQHVILSRYQWQTFVISASASEVTWELWNVENLSNGAGPVRVTRYSDIPVRALTPSDFTVDLRSCSLSTNTLVIAGVDQGVDSQ
jgi:histidine kinase/DNA gyrase B/HSP90-like ATPase